MRPATLSIIAVAVAALILPAPALGARSVHDSTTTFQLMCSDLSSDDGRVSLDAYVSPEYGGGAGLAYWEPGAEPDGPSTWSGYSTSIVLGEDASTLDVTFTVVIPSEVPWEDGDTEDVPGEPPAEEVIGEGALSATFSPSGEPETWEYRDRYGNHRVSGEGTVQWLAVAGTLTLPGDRSFDLGACSAVLEEQHYQTNNPTVSIGQFSAERVSCSWALDDGDVWFFATDGRDGAWAEVMVRTGESWYYGFGSPDLTRTAVAFDETLYTEGGEDGPVAVGTVSAAAALTRADRFKETSVYGGTRFFALGTRLGVDGSLDLDLPDGARSLTMDGAACEAATYKLQEVPGPTVPSKPLGNDAPDGALPLAMGELVTASTGDTAYEPERPCLAIDPESGETYELPMTNSAWWSFDGTGGSITLDTAGSDFDTILGVYVSDGGTVGEGLGCVDDVPESLQARMTLETEAGTAYLVQVGGYGGSTGNLTLELRQP